MSAISKVKITHTIKNSEEKSPFNYVPDELRLMIAKKLSVRDLLSLSRVSKRFQEVATDESLWKPISDSWIFKIPNEPNPYKNWQGIRTRLFNEKIQVNELLLSARFVSQNGENIITANPLILSDEIFRVSVSDYDLKTFKHYALLPSTIVKCNKLFIFAVHSSLHPEVIQARKEKGVHVYELVSGNYITTLSPEFDLIKEISISLKSIKIKGTNKKIVNGKAEEVKSLHIWKILTETKPADAFKCVKKQESSDLITLKHRPSVKIEKVENQKSIQENLNHKLSQSLEKEYRNFRIIKVIRKLDDDFWIVALESKESPEKLKVLVYNSSGTFLKKYEFDLEHIQKVYWFCSRQFIWMVSDLGVIQYFDLLGKSTNAVKRIWGETLKEKTRNDPLYFTEGLSLKNKHLICWGRCILFKKSYLKDPKEILKDAIRCRFFTETINLFPERK